MKTIEISIRQASRAQQILHDTKLDREMEQTTSITWEFDAEFDSDPELDEKISHALIEGGVTEFEIV